MKILTSILLAGTFDDINAISNLCADQSCACDAENLIKWENAMTEWKIDQKSENIYIELGFISVMIKKIEPCP